jgi:hypothetical protein
MTDKRFLFSVMALVALGLPAGAVTVVTYCDGATPGCTNSAASFSSSGLLPITFTGGYIVSNSFTDVGTGTFFGDDAATGGGIISILGDTILDSKGGFQINLPANTLVFALNYLIPSGDTYLVSFSSGGNPYSFSLTSSSSSTAAFFGATSDQAITSLIVYSNFNAQTSAAISNFELQGTGTSDTPEVGTLLLIGFGLISMRYLRRAQVRFFHTPQTA